MSNKLVQTQPSKVAIFQNPQVIDAWRAVAGVDETSFLAQKAMMLTLINGNQKLQSSTPTSLMQAVFEAAMLGLVPAGGKYGAYLIPQWNKDLNAYEARLTIDYHGAQTIIANAFPHCTLRCEAVYDGDGIEFNPPDAPFPFIHTRMNWQATAVVGAWAWLLDNNLHRVTHYRLLNKADLARHRAAAQSTKVWDAHFVEMARKSAIHALLKQMPAIQLASERLAKLPQGVEMAPTVPLPGVVDIEPVNEPNDTDYMQPPKAMDEVLAELAETTKLGRQGLVDRLGAEGIDPSTSSESEVRAAAAKLAKG